MINRTHDIFKYGTLKYGFIDEKNCTKYVDLASRGLFQPKMIFPSENRGSERIANGFFE